MSGPQKTPKNVTEQIESLLSQAMEFADQNSLHLLAAKIGEALDIVRR